MPTGVGKKGFDMDAFRTAEQQNKYPLQITLYQNNGSTVRVGATLNITNDITGQVLTKTTDASGQVLILCTEEFTEGFSMGNRIIIEQPKDDDDMEYFVTANKDATVPTWVEVENGIRNQVKLNTARFKINQTRHQGGYDLSITQNA